MYQTRRIYPRSTATGSAWQVGKGVIFQFEFRPGKRLARPQTMARVNHRFPGDLGEDLVR